MAQQSKPQQSRKQKASQTTSPLIEFDYNGKSYSISPGGLTAVESRSYRQVMGESLSRTMQSGDVDIDVIATLVWIVDRRDNPALTWEQVAGEMTYEGVMDIDVEEAESTDPSG